MSDTTDLETRLVDLGRGFSYPETPETVSAVLVAIGVKTPSLSRRRARTLAVVATCLIVVVLALPGPRRAVADMLGIGGVDLRFVEDLPEAVVIAPFGEPASLEQAAAEVAFPILLPEGHRPDDVFIDRSLPGGLISVAYGDGEGDYRLVVTQMKGTTDQPLIEKEVLPETTVAAVDVAGNPGFWIEGPPHVLMVRVDGAEVRRDQPRLVGNTLVYVKDGVTIRIEIAGTLEDALAVARSLR